MRAPRSGATPTALRGRAFERQTESHAHAKPWAWHPPLARFSKENSRRCLLVPEAVAGAFDEHVLERRLAKRHGLHIVRKGFDQVADKLVTAVLADPQRPADFLRR